MVNAQNNPNNTSNTKAAGLSLFALSSDHTGRLSFFREDIMRHIKLTQGKHAIVDNEDFHYLNQWKWYMQTGVSTNYVFRRVREHESDFWNNKESISMPRQLLVHRGLLDRFDSVLDIDHRNHNGLDNRKSNIRACTRSENIKNQIKHINI